MHLTLSTTRWRLVYVTDTAQDTNSVDNAASAAAATADGRCGENTFLKMMNVNGSITT